MSILVGELTLSNEHQLRMKEIEYLEVAKRSTDMYSIQLMGGTYVRSQSQFNFLIIFLRKENSFFSNSRLFLSLSISSIFHSCF